jgi:serine/threonine protein kinase
MFTNRQHPHALPKGYKLQEYHLQAVLGVGGFGITYLARDTQLNQKVAIKEYFPNDIAVRERDNTLSPKSQTDAKEFKWGLDRFIQEARTLSQFKHPNIVRIMRFFKANNTAYFVMEYEQGQSFADALEDGQTVSEAELILILPPLLDALETVHNAGYLHRDIKPDNIYLRDKDNSPVLLDFGAARFDVSRRSRSVTSIVTPGYAPFEQYESDGSQQGAWTDIYALGAVLYRLIKGNAPIEATKRIRITMRDQPDPLESAVKIGRGKYSKDFLQAIDWALEIYQESRPRNIQAWRKLLLSTSAEPSPSTESPLSKPAPDTLSHRPLFKENREALEEQSETLPDRTWMKKRYAVAVLLLLIAAGGYGLHHYFKEPRLAPPPITEPTTQKTTAQQSDSLEQHETETQRLDAFAQEKARLERELEQLRQQRDTEKQREYIQLAQEDAAEIGKKIWLNESSGKISGLTAWNKGENFASLGIGHFIWYPQGEEKRFTETFPQLLEFMQEQGVILPDWLQNTPNCPWQTRQAFLNNQRSQKMVSLRTLMKNTVPLQAQFIIRRLEMALPNILDTLPTPEQRAHVRKQFYRLAKTPKGIYALIDYVHFKGEGIKPTERYNGQGWGLLQVLEHMSGESVDYATTEFIDAAEYILKRRIQNAPPERNEARWLRGWQNRLDSYQ